MESKAVTRPLTSTSISFNSNLLGNYKEDNLDLDLGLDDEEEDEDDDEDDEDEDDQDGLQSNSAAPGGSSKLKAGKRARKNSQSAVSSDVKRQSTSTIPRIELIIFYQLHCSSQTGISMQNILNLYVAHCKFL
jgi:hypothetical protein